MFADDVSLAGTIRLMGPQNCGAIASGSTDIAVELYRLASRSEAGGCGTQNGRIGDRPGTVMRQAFQPTSRLPLDNVAQLGPG